MTSIRRKGAMLISVKNEPPISGVFFYIDCIAQGETHSAGDRAPFSLDATSGGITALRRITGGASSLDAPELNTYYGGITA